jgi:Holliday junction DNA helicase RuvB
MDIAKRILKLYEEKPEYVAILQACCEAHRRDEESHRQQSYGWLGFEHTDIKLDTDDWKLAMGVPRRLNVLANMGFLEVTFSSNSSTCYKVIDIDEVEEALRSIGEVEEVIEPTPEIEAPQDIFDVIVGYDDVKRVFKKALGTPRLNYLLIGPPACAKTLFIEELRRIKGASLHLGVTSSKSGLRDILLEEKPRILLIDEIERMSGEDMSILHSVMESGYVSETLHRRRREAYLKLQVFATANAAGKISHALRSRFEEIHFPEYTREDFIRVSVGCLTKREGIEPDLANYIAEKAWEISRDVREAIRIGLVAKGKHEVDEYCKFLVKYRCKEER